MAASIITQRVFLLARVSRCSDALRCSTTPALSSHRFSTSSSSRYSGDNQFDRAPRRKRQRRPLDSPRARLQLLRETPGDPLLRLKIANREVTPAQLAITVRSKLDNPAVKPEVTVLALEYLYLAFASRRGDWDPELCEVAKLKAGEATLRHLWEDLDLWRAAIANHDFAKHLCFFLLAEGPEHGIWEMLEHAQRKDVHSRKTNAWRGVLFRSLLTVKIEIGQALGRNIDDAIATFLVLFEEKPSPSAPMFTKQTPKWPAEVAILEAMQQDRSSNTNPVLWDRFQAVFSAPILRVRHGYERSLIVTQLFHPATPNPDSALHYIKQVFTDIDTLAASNRAASIALDFARTIWPRLIEVLKNQGRTDDVTWLSDLGHGLPFDDLMLRVPRKGDTMKPASRDDLRFVGHGVAERGKDWKRVEVENLERRRRDAGTVVLHDFSAPPSWMKTDEGAPA